ncbi:MEDS: MEthanogen/methylotroph, DcmR Sensory domain [Myxococcus fulvus]|uniref:MEDS: MEthanogen/methylotroph, DcmR Sensory domain n=1 Tax=Myxococcus fulvus TaxID=33 RepID=A0ABY1CY01_MYXFU|nr:MEDS: MEthanogen/methylotroph, DcmR Sensory domain [Myxococcus fulvus]
MESRPVTLGGRRLDPHFHACAFFHGAQEEYRVLAPFIQEGLTSGEKALHVTDPRLVDDHVENLKATGIDVEGCCASGQLEVLTWEHGYLKDGGFDPDSMFALFEQAITQSEAAGYPRMRIIGHMEWALEKRSGVEQLIAYEARVNDFLNEKKQPAVCVYDVQRFDAATMMDVLRTHPMVLIGGMLHENPFFVPPHEFLRDLQARTA